MKITIKSTLFALGFLVVAALPAAAFTQNQSRITSASNVRARALPNTTAEEVTKLPIGSVVNQLEQSAAKEKIGNAEDFWYKVALPNDKEGWVFGAFTLPYEAANRAEIYKRIASERLKIKDANFSDSADLARFMSLAMLEVTDKPALAWIELARLLAMKQAGATVPGDKQDQPPYKAWLKANEKSMVYSEPSGMWLVQSDLFWALQKKYATLAIADQIAWEGAKNYIPGECEGYIPCHLGLLTMTDGQYLKLYPKGAHVNEALDSIIEMLEGLTDILKTIEKPDATDRKEANPSIAELQTVINKTTSAKKAKALQMLNQFAQVYR
ncbi:MAG: SH3 domain-containing protein [Acidobacteria bacterium]|nr:SH3 domain-containing protein [Acidobacteriota bacterium]